VMSGDGLLHDKSGVAPVIGVILMVAVTVLLGAVIGMFIFNMDTPEDNAPGVKWLFEEKGIIVINLDENREEIELEAIEAGADDIKVKEDQLEVYTTLDDLQSVKEELSGFNVETSGVGYVPKKKAEADENQREKVETLIDKLKDNSEIQSVYINL